MKKPLILLISLILLVSLAGCSNDVPNITELAVTTDVPAPESTAAEETTEAAETAPSYPVYDGPSSDFRFTLSNFISNDAFGAYSSFLEKAEKSFLVPALAEKMVPQGMDIWEERGWLLISGYFDDPAFCESSVLLAVDMNTGAYVGEYYLTNTDGTPHTSHAGGVAVTDKNIYISSDEKLYRIPLSHLLEVGQCGKLTIADYVSVPVRASYCNYSEGYLWVGEFAYGSSYPTDKSHRVKNRSGLYNTAWTVGYELDPESETGFKPEALAEGSYATPDVIFSMTEKIQGFTVTAESVILSQSYGRTNDSDIWIYENPMSGEPHKTVKVNEKDIPFYFLDGAQPHERINSLPMSEGVTARGGSLYILFESGADKYANGGGKCPTENVWVYKLK